MLSPSSAVSEFCKWEVEEALRLNKRILPVVCRPLGGASPPPQLASLNYIWLYREPSLQGSGFGVGLAELVKTLNTDLDWLREHTRYLQRATEWDLGGRTANRLLSGADICSAKDWAECRPKNAPAPTEVQLAFIKASEVADIQQKDEAAKKARELAEALESAKKERDRALLQESRALAIFARQASDVGDHATAMLLALEALPEPGFGGERPLSFEAAAALHQAWLRNRETTLAGHRGKVISTVFSPDGTRVFTASQDGTARVWDLRSRRPTVVVLEGFVDFALFSPDGTHVVTVPPGFYDCTALVWDLRQKEPSFIALEGHQRAVISASFSLDGTLVATASWDETARVWDAASGRELATLKGHEGRVLSTYFSADGTHVVTASGDMTARVWDWRAQPPSFVVLEGHQDTVGSASFSPDGTRVVTASWDRDKTARVWDAASGRELVTLKGHKSRVVSASFSARGTHVVTASHDCTARVWDWRAEPARFVVLNHEYAVIFASFSVEEQEEQYVITRSGDGTARVWDWVSKPPSTIECEGHKELLQPALFSPDRTRVLTVPAEGTVRVRDLCWERPSFVAFKGGHYGPVVSASFSPDETHVVTASDRVTSVWVLRGERRLRVGPPHRGPSGLVFRSVRIPDDEPSVVRELWGDHQVRSAAFSPGGTQVVTASADKTAQIWDLRSEQRSSVGLEGHQGPINSASFSQDGAHVVTASSDKCQCSPKRDPGCASKRDPSEGARGVVPRHPDWIPCLTKNGALLS